jgi:hypothetical protein
MYVLCLAALVAVIRAADAGWLLPQAMPRRENRCLSSIRSRKIFWIIRASPKRIRPAVMYSNESA